ncbi:MAG TPA: class I SAM-dependent methyltransferase [Actinomycetota bacterium]|nr:class I SAM-dependent methyltransferase [Actinomycetota bacterium]
MLSDEHDAFGVAMLTHLERGSGVAALERDDGFIEGHPMDGYFTTADHWPPEFVRELDELSGRVLDVGCGAGRVALYLQEHGCQVVGIDSSPAAVETSRRRGVLDARILALQDIGPELGLFDAIVFAGNNLALAGTPPELSGLLRRLRDVTHARSVIVADGLDPYTTDDPVHLTYHERNRARARPGGQVTMRVRFRDRATPWFELLLRSRDELLADLEGTGWGLRRWADSRPGWRAPEEGRTSGWVAVLERDP